MKPDKYPDDIDLVIDAGKIVHTMRGGIGASWHAMSEDIPLDNDRYRYPVREQNPRGSAYGGNPPVDRLDLWSRLYDHASWLGLNFVRVELSQRMYEPGRREFDWENDEMKALYNILDWCERSGADAFLQQMWGHVEWNAYPGVHPLLSAPHSLDEFAIGIATLLDHLVNVRRYTCIRYFSITNEPPGGTFGYWWSSGPRDESITPALKRVKEQLDRRGIEIPLSGPDWTSLPRLVPSMIDFDEYIGAYDIHSYDGIDETREGIVDEWIEWAHSRNKPLFLTEFGNMNLGWGGNDPGPSTFEAALSNASDIVKCLNMGVDGLNRWSFVNRGDLDGRWQLVRTWDPVTKKYLDVIKPEREAYLGFGIISRFIPKYSSVISSSKSSNPADVRIASVISRKNQLTAIILNGENRPVDAAVRILNRKPETNLNLYQVTSRSAGDPDFNLEPAKVSSATGGVLSIELPGESISVLSDYSLTSEENGVLA